MDIVIKVFLLLLISMSNDRETSGLVAYKNKCEFLVIPLTPDKIGDNYLRQIIVSCFPESEVSANFDWQI